MLVYLILSSLFSSRKFVLVFVWSKNIILQTNFEVPFWAMEYTVKESVGPKAQSINTTGRETGTDSETKQSL